MKKFLILQLVIVASCVAFGFFVRFDGYQTNGDFRVNGSVYGTTWNGIKVYRAVMSQSGTGNPTVTVLENTFGVTFTWGRGSAGVYAADGSLITGTTSEKILCFFSLTNSGGCKEYQFFWNEAGTEFNLNTFSGIGVAADVGGSADATSSIEILQYP